MVHRASPVPRYSCTVICAYRRYQKYSCTVICVYLQYASHTLGAGVSTVCGVVERTGVPACRTGAIS